MKIAISGASSVGKTTLLNEIEKNNKKGFMNLDITNIQDVVSTIRSMHSKGLRITVQYIHKYMNADDTQESHKSCFEAMLVIENEIRLNNIEEITRMDNIAPKGICLEYYKMKYYRDPLIAKLHKKYLTDDWSKVFQKLPLDTEKSIEFAKNLI